MTSTAEHAHWQPRVQSVRCESADCCTASSSAESYIIWNIKQQTQITINSLANNTTTSDHPPFPARGQRPVEKVRDPKSEAPESRPLGPGQVLVLVALRDEVARNQGAPRQNSAPGRSLVGSLWVEKPAADTGPCATVPEMHFSTMAFRGAQEPPPVPSRFVLDASKIRTISLLRLSPLRLLDSTFPGNSLWT